MILASDVLRWLVPTVAKFPRGLRYGFGADIESAMLDVLENLVVAQYSRGQTRYDALGHANARLQVLRHLLRMTTELGALSRRQGLHVTGMVVELGKQVGGWRKASDATGNSSRASSSPVG